MGDNNNNATPLSNSEYKKVGAAVYDRVCDYPNLPANAVVDYQALNGIGHLGVMSVPGGKYRKRYITGGFEAEYPFQILYKTSPTENSLSFNAESLIDDLADWLEQRPYPTLTDDRVVERISMDSTTYISTADNDGSVVYVRSGVVTYEKI